MGFRVFCSTSGLPFSLGNLDKLGNLHAITEKTKSQGNAQELWDFSFFWEGELLIRISPSVINVIYFA